MAEVLVHVDGMSCGACAARVDRALKSVPGVNNAAVNLTTGMARVEGTIAGRGEDLLSAIKDAGYSGDLVDKSSAAGALQSVRERGILEAQRVRRDMWIGIFAGIPVVVIDLFMQRLMRIHSDPGLLAISIAQALFATIVVVITGRSFFSGAWRIVRHGSANMDVLVALGSGVAYLYSLAIMIPIWLGHGAKHAALENELHAAVVIIVLVKVGKFLEARAKFAAASAVGGLAVETAATTTRLLPNGNSESIPAEHLQIGDHLQVLAHQKIPVDGEVIEGAGSADLAVITGESIPVEVKPGVSLPGGATIADGRIVLRATATANASTVARIWDLVNNAQASKTQIQGLADKVAGIFVPIVMALALIALIGWSLAGAGWQRGLIAAIATIVVACPCAMGLATPTAITVALGTAAKRGILFTRASALERAGKIHTVVFDKTGTLTEGKPSVSDVHPVDTAAITAAELLRIAASLEQFSDHPLAKAIVRAAEQDGVTFLEPERFSSVPGGGVRGTFPGNNDYAAGSTRFLETLGIESHASIDGFTNAGQTVVAVADLNGKSLIGVIGLRDALRPESLIALRQLKSQNKHIVVLSGDSQAAVEGALKSAPVDTIRAGMSPDGKAHAIEEFRQISPGVAFIGDGVNDGPALAAADLGIAMAGGTDLAKAAGDVLLVGNRIAAVPEVLEISRRTMRIIRQNLFWAFAYNVAAIPLAMFGILPPGVAAGAMVLSSLTVVGNALRLRRPPVTPA